MTTQILIGVFCVTACCTIACCGLFGNRNGFRAYLPALFLFNVGIAILCFTFALTSQKEDDDKKNTEIKKQQIEDESFNMHERKLGHNYSIKHIKVDGIIHEYLFHQETFIGLQMAYQSESMCHYPECKFCKQRKEGER